MTVVGHEGGTEVVGGSGGTVAHLDDMTRAVSALVAAADRLGDAAHHARDIRAAVTASQPWSPPTAQDALAEVGALLDGAVGLLRLEADLRLLADSLRRAVGGYRSAETEAQRAATAAAARAGHLLGSSPGGWLLGGLLLSHVVLPAAGVGALAGRPPTAAAAERVVAGGSGVLVGAAPGPHLSRTGHVPAAARMLSTLSTLGPGGTRLHVLETTSSGTRGDVAAGTTGQVLSGIAPLYPARGALAGSVSVQRLEHRDGTRSWVVRIPGTQRLSFRGGAVPADMQSNLQLVGRRVDDASRLAVTAMRRAGIRPGEPVLLAGHSQGGAAAAAIATHPALREEFTVAAVVTAGSPVGGIPVPADVPALHLEHVEDLVPATDGSPNPASAHRTTVRIELDASPSAADRAVAGSIGGSHGIDAYTRSANRLDDLAAPSVERFERVVAGVLGDGDARSSTRVWTGRRVPG